VKRGVSLERVTAFDPSAVTRFAVPSSGGRFATSGGTSMRVIASRPGGIFQGAYDFDNSLLKRYPGAAIRGSSASAINELTGKAAIT